MNITQAVKANLKLFTLAYVAWIAATSSIFIEPFPSASAQPDVFGYFRVVACLLDTGLRYQSCAGFMNLLAASMALIFRAGAVFVAPLILLLGGTDFFLKFNDRHKSNPPATQIKL